MKLKYHFGKTEKENRQLNWQVDSTSTSIDFDGRIVGSAYSPGNELVLVLTGSESENHANKLYGFRISGELIFETNEPKGYSFYYLSSHVNHETAVVCISKGHSLDGYYSIDPSNGKLEPLNRAY